MASRTSSAIWRLPKQERGRLRVVSLLAAAEAVIGEKGYDAATMTAVAERAGAAIGSLYQFFPTKEAVADRLRGRLNDDLCATLAALADAAPGWPPSELARRLFGAVIGFLQKHPALLAIAEARGKAGGAASVRPRLRAAIAEVIAANSPDLSSERTRRSAIVVWQLIRAGATLETDLRERRAALQEIEGVLAAYLAATLGR